MSDSNVDDTDNDKKDKAFNEEEERDIINKTLLDITAPPIKSIAFAEPQEKETTETKKVETTLKIQRSEEYKLDVGPSKIEVKADLEKEEEKEEVEVPLNEEQPECTPSQQAAFIPQNQCYVPAIPDRNYCNQQVQPYQQSFQQQPRYPAYNPQQSLTIHPSIRGFNAPAMSRHVPVRDSYCLKGAIQRPPKKEMRISQHNASRQQQRASYIQPRVNSQLSQRPQSRPVPQGSMHASFNAPLNVGMMAPSMNSPAQQNRNQAQQQGNGGQCILPSNDCRYKTCPDCNESPGVRENPFFQYPMEEPPNPLEEEKNQIRMENQQLLGQQPFPNKNFKSSSKSHYEDTGITNRPLKYAKTIKLHFVDMSNDPCYGTEIGQTRFCTRCGKPVYKCLAIDIEEKSYHQDCFTCANPRCGERLNEDNICHHYQEVYCNVCGPKFDYIYRNLNKEYGLTSCCWEMPDLCDKNPDPNLDYGMAQGGISGQQQPYPMQNGANADPCQRQPCRRMPLPRGMAACFEQQRTESQRNRPQVQEPYQY